MKSNQKSESFSCSSSEITENIWHLLILKGTAVKGENTNILPNWTPLSYSVTIMFVRLGLLTQFNSEW